MHIRTIIDKYREQMAAETGHDNGLWDEMYNELGWVPGEPVVCPLGNRVIVSRTPPKAKEGEIEIPEIARSAPNTGTIIAIGPEVTTLRVGDFVVFGHYQIGTEIPGPDGKAIHLFSEPEILAIYGAGGRESPVNQRKPVGKGPADYFPRPDAGGGE